MAVTLDNIQFYHGPSRPARPPYFAFNSNKSASNTMLSGEEAAFSYVPDSSVADDSTIIPNCFLPPAANAEDTTHQNAVGSPNLFDIELASSWEDPTPLSSTRESGDGHACPSLQKFDCHHQERSDEKTLGDMSLSLDVDPRESAEFGDSSFFPGSQSICTRPSPPPESYSTAELSPYSTISPHEIMQSHMLDDTQQGQGQPSHRAYAKSPKSFCQVDTWDMSDVSTAFGEHSPNIPISVSSCSDVATKQPNGSVSYVSSPEDRSDDCEGENQTRSHPDCNPRTIAVSGGPGPVNPLQVDAADLMDLEQTTRRKSARLRTSSVQSDKNRTLLISRGRRKRKERAMSSTGKRDTARKESRSSVAVVIPPSRPWPSRATRPKFKAVPSDVCQSDSSEDFDDSLDEDFTSDAIQSESSDIEDYQCLRENRDLTSTAGSYHPHDVSVDSSACHRESRDIVGRAILTIETEGSEPSFFFTLVPDGVRSTPSVLGQILSHSPGKQDRILKRSVAVGRSACGKGKCRPYSPDEDHLLVKLKEEKKLTWEEITDHFPGRTSSALQVHYSTKLKQPKTKRSHPQSRRGKKK